MDLDAKAFYDRGYAQGGYAFYPTPESHPFRVSVEKAVQEYRLADRRCLEIGCGRGALQDVVDDYTGFDLSESVRPYLHKPFVQGSATALPFADGVFGAVWTYAALEHISQPELALAEIRRVLCDGGVLLLHAAWQCRPWARHGLAVRPYGDLPFLLKVHKVLIPVRDSVCFRSMFVFPRRFWRLLSSSMRRRPTRLRYRLLRPNYDRYWCADSDAVNHMDPYEAILWFTSRGDECLNHPTALRCFFVRTGCLAFRMRKG